MATPSPKRSGKKLPSVLTSDVHNEAEFIFSILENKDRKCISHLDVLTLLRGIGMNPWTADMDYLREVMAAPIAKLEELRIEEEKRKEREKKKEEAKGKGGKKEAKKPEAKKADPKKDGSGATDGAAPAEGEKKEKVMTEPAEEIKNIDWTIFINHVEPIYRDNHTEQQEIIAALNVFDSEKNGRITRERLIEIVTANGESVLSPAEVKQLTETFPEEFDFIELAQRLQGTFRPKTQAEIDAQLEKERVEMEAAAKKAREDAAAADPLAGLL